MNTDAYPLSDFVEALPDILADGGTFKMYPRGSSMLPLIRSERDAVVLCAPDNLEKHDVVLFRRKNGSLVLHRITELPKVGTITVCGDSQTWTEAVEREQIVAKVTEIIRGKRKVTRRRLCYRLYIFLWSLHYPRRFYAQFMRVLSRKGRAKAKE